MGTLASRSRLPVIAIRAVLGAVALALFVLVLAAETGPAGASPSAPTQDGAGCRRDGCVNVVAVNGLIDEIEADFIIDSLAASTPRAGVVAVVLQVDSAGVAVDEERFAEVARAVVDSEVPVSVWVGPSGSDALGGAVELVAVADSSGVAPGSGVGDAGEQRLSVEEFGELVVEGARDDVLVGRQAVRAGAVDRFSPTIGDHIVNLDGVETRTLDRDGQRRQVPVPDVVFSKLPLSTQLFHTVASPSVAYLLLAVGLGLLLFEFFTAGVGVAGVVGAVCTVLAAYGVAALPHSTWALALVVGSMVAFAIDVQTGIPRFWTSVGMSAFTIGSIFLFTDFRPTWIALAAGIGGMAVTMFSGMPSMVRTRFATPTIGRDWMVGEMGDALTAVDPDGTVRVSGGLWRAHTNRATPVAAGDRVRVVSIDGLVLEVEPEEGGAVDHREMRQRRRDRSGAPDAPDDPAADA